MSPEGLHCSREVYLEIERMWKLPTNVLRVLTNGVRRVSFDKVETFGESHPQSRTSREFLLIIRDV